MVNKTPSASLSQDSPSLKGVKKGTRKQTDKACDYCRYRHIRCNGITPCCDQCEKRGRDCTYDGTPVVSGNKRQRKSTVNHQNSGEVKKQLNSSSAPSFLQTNSSGYCSASSSSLSAPLASPTSHLHTSPSSPRSPRYIDACPSSSPPSSPYSPKHSSPTPPISPTSKKRSNISKQEREKEKSEKNVLNNNNTKASPLHKVEEELKICSSSPCSSLPNHLPFPAIISSLPEEIDFYVDDRTTYDTQSPSVISSSSSSEFISDSPAMQSISVPSSIDELLISDTWSWTNQPNYFSDNDDMIISNQFQEQSSLPDYFEEDVLGRRWTSERCTDEDNPDLHSTVQPLQHQTWNGANPLKRDPSFNNSENSDFLANSEHACEISSWICAAV